MLKKIGITMAFVGALMLSLGVTNIFAGVCGCPKDAKCADKCEPGKSDPCKCKH